MYLVETYDKAQMAGTMFALSRTMYNLPDEVVEQADECEVWGTSFNEGSSDYCEFRFKKDGTVFRTIRVEGY